ncbi:hypothetical protein NIES4074_24770 [Cylindrospermum sp. NIES-4074]|nr:hypothetical protein NIES4074_24770 [Cylindrospermum sp. NIES-4074]
MQAIESSKLAILYSRNLVNLQLLGLCKILNLGYCQTLQK